MTSSIVVPADRGVVEVGVSGRCLSCFSHIMSQFSVAYFIYKWSQEADAEVSLMRRKMQKNRTGEERAV